MYTFDSMSSEIYDLFLYLLFCDSLLLYIPESSFSIRTVASTFLLISLLNEKRTGHIVFILTQKLTWVSLETLISTKIPAKLSLRRYLLSETRVLSVPS